MRTATVTARRNKTPSAALAQRRLEQGQVALTSGAWKAARGAFEAALAVGETAEALEGLGAAAWWLDDGDTVFRARERAYELYRRHGDPVSAARLAFELAEDYMYFYGEPAVGRGWLKRAHRLLDGRRRCPEHGWLALIEGDFAISVDNDPAATLKHARTAANVARRLKLIDLEMLALSLEGLALVSSGKFDEGMPRLDEAAAAAVSGEMTDLLAISFTCCYLITACERARDYERAAQWCKRAHSFCQRIRFPTLFSICRVQYASVLSWRGDWGEAETELNAAIRQLAATHPAQQLEGVVRLAELRRRQGRMEEVLTLLKQAADHPRSLLERAALALERDDAEAAAQFAQRFLRQTPTDNRVDRLPGLDVLLRAELARGDHKAAEKVLSEIQAAAAGVSTAALRAGARLAEGLVAAARGEHAAAGAAFEDAIDLYSRSGAPFEKARACLELSRTLFARGREDDARHEARAALDVFQQLGAEQERRVVEALLRPVSSVPVGAGLSRRELEVLKLLAQGLSNQKIARLLQLSEFTVKRHVANILTKLDLPTRAAAAAYAARQGLL